MRSLLIIWFFNGGELALTSEVIAGPLTVCQSVMQMLLADLAEHKTLRGMNRGVYGTCVEIPAAAGES